MTIREIDFLQFVTDDLKDILNEFEIVPHCILMDIDAYTFVKTFENILIVDGDLYLFGIKLIALHDIDPCDQYYRLGYSTGDGEIVCSSSLLKELE